VAFLVAVALRAEEKFGSMSDFEGAGHSRHRRRGSRRRRKRFWLAIAVGVMVAALLAGTLWLINRSTPSSRRRQIPLFPANSLPGRNSIAVDETEGASDGFA
jgi:hypothetical protein